MMYKKAVVIVVLWLSAITCPAQVRVTNLDVSFQFRSGTGMRGDIMHYRQDSALYISLAIHSPLDSLRHFEVSYSLLNSLNEEVKTIIPLKKLPAYFQYETENKSVFGFKLAAHDEKFFVLWLADTVSRQIFPYVKSLQRYPQAADMLVQHNDINTPVFDYYLPTGSRVRLQSLTVRQTIVVDYYDYHFMPARPPMLTTADTTGADFSPDETITLNSGQEFEVDKAGMYYFHLQDYPTGYTLIARDQPFPRFGTIDMLSEALRYITTSEEYTKLHTTFDKKKMFDEFWLNNTLSQSKAKRAIKEYYKRATQANQLFTTYKEGWKTDMGMIYIIFGPPPKVFWKDDGLLWIYPKTFELPRVAFFFKNIQSAFTERQYVLERKEEYRNIWLRTIDLWRSGRKAF